MHGSAPDIVGKNICNPIAMFFSMVMMLEYFNENIEAKRLKTAILNTLKQRDFTPDLGGICSTEMVTNSVISNLQDI